MMQGNNMLVNFPKTYAFIAYAAAGIKGESVDFWMDALKDYHIGNKCQCGQCYTFGLIPPEGDGAFGRKEMIRFFDDTVVILHNDKNGGLIEIELPEITAIPFADEYEVLDTDFYSSTETSEEAYATVKKWFENCSI
jgi:hypothetical protein